MFLHFYLGYSQWYHSEIDLSRRYHLIFLTCSCCTLNFDFWLVGLILLLLVKARNSLTIINFFLNKDQNIYSSTFFLPSRKNKFGILIFNLLIFIVLGISLFYFYKQNYVYTMVALSVYLHSYKLAIVKNPYK